MNASEFSPQFPSEFPSRSPSDAKYANQSRSEFAPLGTYEVLAYRPVLVTGATGFVGSHVARMLAERGTLLRVLVRSNSRLDNLKALPSDQTEIVIGDLTNPPSLQQAVQGCDTIYHVAADYRLWARDPQELYRSNVEGTCALLQAALEAGVRRVVYCSTVGALGIPHDGRPGTEETPVAETDMIGHYKRSKFLAEQEARQFVGRGLEIVIVNPSTPVGENDIKPTPTGQIIVDFLNRRLPAYIDTGLNLVDVRDVAAGMLLAAERGRPGERYILGNRNVTLKEMLEMLARITGLPAPRIQVPYAVAWLTVGMENLIAAHLLRRAPAHPFEGVQMARHKMFFDAGKAVRELGMPQSSIRDALARAVTWFQSNGYVKTE